MSNAIPISISIPIPSPTSTRIPNPTPTSPVSLSYEKADNALDHAVGPESNANITLSNHNTNVDRQIDHSSAHSQQTDSSPSKQPLPWAFIDCPTDTLVILISHMLNLLIQHNDQVVLTPDALTRFHSRAPPGISVIEYLRRIVKYTNMEKIPLLSLLAYIDVTCQALPTFTLSSLTVHRFLIAGVCAGSKAQCDVFCTNAHYAKVGGIKTGELNALEREFLRVTGWALCCNADLLQRYYTSLIRSHGGYTQSPPPEISPFQPFPHSVSKPSSPSSSTSSLQSELGGAGGDDEEMVEIDSPEQNNNGNRPSRGESVRASKSRRLDGSDQNHESGGVGPERSRGRDTTRSSSGHGSERRRTDHVPLKSGSKDLLNGGNGLGEEQEEGSDPTTEVNDGANHRLRRLQGNESRSPIPPTREDVSEIPMAMDVDPPESFKHPIPIAGRTTSSSASSYQSIPYSINSAPQSETLRSTSTSISASSSPLNTFLDHNGSHHSHDQNYHEGPSRPRSRAMSITSSAKVAEPVLDVSLASGQGAPWVDSESYPRHNGVIVNEGDVIHGDTPSDAPQNGNNAHDRDGGDTSKDENGSHSHHPKLLRHLVGGIFKRKTHAPIASTSATASSSSTSTSSSATNRRSLSHGRERVPNHPHPHPLEGEHGHQSIQPQTSISADVSQMGTSVRMTGHEDGRGHGDDDGNGRTGHHQSSSMEGRHVNGLSE